MLQKSRVLPLFVFVFITGYVLFRSQPFLMPFKYADLIAHAILFITITAYVQAAFPDRTGLTLAMLFSLAIGSELIQSTAFLPLRTMSMSDALANLGGVILASGLPGVMSAMNRFRSPVFAIKQSR